MKRRDIINYLIEKYGYKSYLEIGVGNGANFRQIKCEEKHSVDPAYAATFKMTSDAFFKKLDPQIMYDIVFIDGCHTKRAVVKDIDNSLKHLNADGIILIHDVNPTSARLAKKRPKESFSVWFGDVFKAIMILRSTRSDLIVGVIDTDCGVGFVKPTNKVQALIKIHDLTYETMDKDRKKTIGLIPIDEFFSRF